MDNSSRFERLARLTGTDGLKKLAKAHVMIIGIGGVGSWAAEALARTGIGHLTLIDFDTVKPSNTNRQLTAFTESVGMPKAEVMAERIKSINPEAEVSALKIAFTPDTAEQIFAIKPDIILDAIDNITYKCRLLAQAQKRSVPIVTSTGAAGRFDPLMVKVTDLSHTKVDPVALQVRKKLRRDYGYPSKRSFHIPAVFSDEIPLPPATETEEGYIMRGCKPPSGTPHGEAATDDSYDEDNTVRKAPPLGTASFVTGAFGLAAASVITRMILEKE